MEFPENPPIWLRKPGERHRASVALEAKDAVWQFFVESVRDYLHIVRVSMVSAVEMWSQEFAQTLSLSMGPLEAKWFTR